MLNKLRLKLTLICTLITASVLMITVVILFFQTKYQFQTQSHYALDTELHTLIYYLQITSSAPNSMIDYRDNIYFPQSISSRPRIIHTISHTWLLQLENVNHSVIYLEEDHSPLLFTSSYKTLTPHDELITRAKKEVHDQYHFNYYAYSSSQANTLNAITFDFRPTSKEHYLVATAAISTNTTNYEILILKDMHGYDIKILQQFFICLVLLLFGTGILSLFSYWFSGRAILPVIESEKRQKEFVAAASHELRSPLTVLSTSSSALAVKYPVIKDSYFYHSIETECKSMTRLISDLLLLSHADTHSHWTLESKRTEADTLLLELYDSFEPLARSSQHHLELDLPDDTVPPCQIDGMRITQVLSILINNALAYTPEGSTITLSLSITENHKLCFVVKDNGPGISDEHKVNVFKRFYRIDPSRHQKDHSGLGLSIAYELVNLHKGRIILEDALPHGCIFRILLPLNE